MVWRYFILILALPSPEFGPPGALLAFNGGMQADAYE
jgi:hypothetical protein